VLVSAPTASAAARAAFDWYSIAAATMSAAARASRDTTGRHDVDDDEDDVDDDEHDDDDDDDDDAWFGVGMVPLAVESTGLSPDSAEGSGDTHAWPAHSVTARYCS
jgi:ABC-type Zn2+ transport system substrate-binding protein/surface adhesin